MSWGEIEDGRLTLMEGTHHLKSHDGCVGCLQRLEAPHGADQLLQLAVISLSDVVQILDLSMHRALRGLVFGLEF